MKKAMVFLGLVVSLGLFLSLNHVFGSTTATTDTASSSTTTKYIFTDTNYYYYSDYQELVSKVYKDAYDEFYSQIYDQVINDITDDFYQQIYDQVQSDLEGVLSEEQMALYIANFQQQIYDVVDIASQSVLGVTTYTPTNGTNTGSGVVFRYDAENDTFYLLTNYHVVANFINYEPDPESPAPYDPSIDITFGDGRTASATIYGYDTEVDLAVLVFSGVGHSDLVVSEFADPNSLAVGDFVFAVGNPLGNNFYNSVTMGIVGGLDRKVETDRFVDFIQHDAAINSGNSGGPIYDISGKIAGINVLKYANVEIEGMGFSIPVDLILRVLARMDAHDMTYHTIMPRLGASYYVLDELDIEGRMVHLQTISYSGKILNDLDITLPFGVYDGLIINNDFDDQTLDGYLTGGDLIVGIDGYRITTKQGFLDYFYGHYEAGDMVTFHFYAFDDKTYTYSTVQSSVTVQLK